MKLSAAALKIHVKMIFFLQLTFVLLKLLQSQSMGIEDVLWLNSLQQEVAMHTSKFTYHLYSVDLARNFGDS
jgi:hypothetical protein